MPIKVDTVRLPAFLASALVNGEDTTDHSTDCASRESAEPYFSRDCDLPGWHLGADMLDYVVLHPEAL